MLKYLQEVWKTLWKEASRSKLKARKDHESNSFDITNGKSLIKPEILAPNVGNEKRDVEKSKGIVKVKRTYDMLMKKFINPKLDLAPSLKSLSTLEQIKLFDLKKKKEMLKTSMNNLLSDSTKKKKTPPLPQSSSRDESKVLVSEGSYGWSGQPTSKHVFNTRVETAVVPSGIDSAFFVFPEMERFWKEKNKKSNTELKSIFRKPKIKKIKKKLNIPKSVELIKKIPKSHICKFYEKDVHQLGKEILRQSAYVDCDVTKKQNSNANTSTTTNLSVVEESPFSNDSRQVNTYSVNKSARNVLPSESTKPSDSKDFSASDETQQNPPNFKYETQLNNLSDLNETVNDSQQNSPFDKGETMLDTKKDTNNTKMNRSVNSRREIEGIKDCKTTNRKDSSQRKERKKILNERINREVSIPTNSIVLAKESAVESNVVHKTHINSSPKSHKCDVLISSKQSVPKSTIKDSVKIPTQSETSNESLLKNQSNMSLHSKDKDINEEREIVKVHSLEINNDNLNTNGKKSELNINTNSRNGIVHENVHDFQNQSLDPLQSTMKSSIAKQQGGSRSGVHRQCLEIDLNNHKAQSDKSSKKSKVIKQIAKKENLTKTPLANHLTNSSRCKASAENKPKPIVIKSNYLKFVKNKAWYYNRNSRRKARKSKSEESLAQVQQSSGEKQALIEISNSLKRKSAQKGNRKTKDALLRAKKSKEDKILTNSKVFINNSIIPYERSNETSVSKIGVKKQLPNNFKMKLKTLTNTVSPSTSALKKGSNEIFKRKSDGSLTVLKRKLPTLTADDNLLENSNISIQRSKRNRGLRRSMSIVTNRNGKNDLQITNDPECQIRVIPHSFMEEYKIKSPKSANNRNENTRVSSSKSRQSDLSVNHNNVAYIGRKTGQKTFNSTNTDISDVAVKLDLISKAGETIVKKRKLHSRKSEPKSINLKMYGIEKSSNVVPANEMKSLKSVKVMYKKGKNKKQHKIEYPYLSLKTSARKTRSNSLELSSMALPTKILSRNLVTIEYKANKIINYLWRRYASTAVNHIKSNKNLTNHKTSVSCKKDHNISNMLGETNKTIKIAKGAEYTESIKSNVKDTIKPGGNKSRLISNKNVASAIQNTTSKKVPIGDLGCKLNDKKTVGKYEQKPKINVNKSQENFKKNVSSLSKMNENKKDYNLEVLFSRQEDKKDEILPQKHIQTKKKKIASELSKQGERSIIPSKFNTSIKSQLNENQRQTSNNNIVQNIVKIPTKKTSAFNDKRKETSIKRQNSCSEELNSSQKIKSVRIEINGKTQNQNHNQSNRQPDIQYSSMNLSNRSPLNQSKLRETSFLRPKLGKTKKLALINNLAAKSKKLETDKKTQDTRLRSSKKLERMVFAGSGKTIVENFPRWKSRDDRLNGWSQKVKLESENAKNIKDIQSKECSSNSLKSTTVPELKPNTNTAKTLMKKVITLGDINKGLTNKNSHESKALEKKITTSSMNEANVKILKCDDTNLKKQKNHQVDENISGFKATDVGGQIVVKNLPGDALVSEMCTEKHLKLNNNKETVAQDESNVQHIKLQYINLDNSKIAMNTIRTPIDKSSHKKEQINTTNISERHEKKNDLDKAITNTSNISNKKSKNPGDRKKTLIFGPFLTEKNPTETTTKVFKTLAKNKNNGVAMRQKSLNRLSTNKVNLKLSKSETNHLKSLDTKPKDVSEALTQGLNNPVQEKQQNISVNRSTKKDNTNINNDIGVNKYNNALYEGHHSNPKSIKDNTISGQGDGLFRDQAKQMGTEKEIRKTIPIPEPITQNPKFPTAKTSFSTFSLTRAEIKNLIDKVQNNNLKYVNEKTSDVKKQSIEKEISNEKSYELNDSKIKFNAEKNQLPLTNQINADTIQLNNSHTPLQQKVHPIEKEKYNLEFIVQTPSQIQTRTSPSNTVISQSIIPVAIKNTYYLNASRNNKENNKLLENHKQNQSQPISIENWRPARKCTLIKEHQ